MDNNEHMNKVYDVILSADQIKPKLTESQFKKDLLPILVAKEDSGVDLTIWLTMAGSWTRAIDVIDDKTQELLFTVPALVGTSEISTYNTSEESVYEIIETARRKMAVMPAAGSRYMTERLSNRINVKNTHDENLKVWNEIYRRYGYPEMASDAVTKEDSTSNTGKSVKIETDGYDDL